MKRIKRTILCFTFSFFIFSLFPKSIYSNSVERRPHILILNSFHSGYEWSDSIIEEIIRTLKAKFSGIDISIEHMDTQRVFDQHYYEQLCNIYKYKYSNQKIDTIISIDNNAYDFLLKYRDDIFHNTPVVFCGVNNFDKNRLIGHELFTGIAENADIKANIDIAFKLHPNAKNIAVITSKDTTNVSLKNNFLLEVLAKKERINLTYIEDTDIDIIKDKISKLPENSIIFIITPVFKDYLGAIIPETEAVKSITSTLKIPVYSFWGYYINSGIIGGMLTSGSTQGSQAAEMVLKILKGTSVRDIPVINDRSSNKLIFDYNKLQYFGINTNLLPDGSTIINGPSKSYTIDKHTTWFIALIVILLLSITVIVLSITVSKLKHMDTIIKESEKRYRMLIDFLPDAIYVSHNGINLFSNAAGLKLLGLKSPDELTGREMIEFINTNSSTIDKEAKNLFLNNCAMPLQEYEIARKDGTKTYAESTSIPFSWNGKASLLIAARDITERKQAEELKMELEKNNTLLKQAMESDILKTEFFTNMSHELKTPLNVVLSSAQMLEAINNGNIKFEDNAKIEKYISMMKQNCLRLIRLVDNLIDSTKIDAGYYKLNLKCINIVNIVENTALSVVKYVEDKGIKLIFDTDVEEKIILGDAEKIERIILNLLSNATKFTNPGGNILVNIHDKANSVIISVKDTGIGIPKEKQKYIFERFIQVDESLERNHLGSGIGLSIVKSLVEMHGGKITLESEPGHGSQFIIELPAIANSNGNDSIESIDCSEQLNDERIKIEFSDI